jgi:hypothetical protein
MQQNVAENIVQAVAITSNPMSTQQQRAEAVKFFEEVMRKPKITFA